MHILALARQLLRLENNRLELPLRQKPDLPVTPVEPHAVTDLYPLDRLAEIGVERLPQPGYYIMKFATFGWEDGLKGDDQSPRKIPPTTPDSTPCCSRPMLFQDLGPHRLQADRRAGNWRTRSRSRHWIWGGSVEQTHMASKQLRLWWASFAYLLVERLRAWRLKGTALAEATVGRVRLQLLKVAAQVTVSVRGRVGAAELFGWKTGSRRSTQG